MPEIMVGRHSLLEKTQKIVPVLKYDENFWRIMEVKSGQIECPMDNNISINWRII